MNLHVKTCTIKHPRPDATHPASKFLVALVVTATLLCDAVPAPLPAPAPKYTFAITSVEYTGADGTKQTQAFNANGSAQIPAVAAKSNIVIRGTYTPTRGTVAGTISVSNFNGPEQSGRVITNIGNWSFTIPASQLVTNQSCTAATRTGGKDNTIMINDVPVTTSPKDLTISLN
jgi:hypothetical protein